MRFIDSKYVGGNLPNGWGQRAQQAEKAVAAAQPEDRSAEVDKHRAVWQDLKNTLRQASHLKCWYCESGEIRSDNAVDHFRPKRSVAECPGHEGYWWLAFKWENYRFCCTFCNCRRVDPMKGDRGGKAGHFPLKDEARRAKTPADNLENEEPLLLDPTVPADPGLLWFDETGRAAPSPACCNNVNGYPYKRVVESIGLYHLNHTDVVERRKVLCADIRRSVANANRYFEKYDSGDGTAQAAFEDAVCALRERLSPSAEYSATARAMLMGLRGTYPFVEVILAA